jgi:hypothetical protein
VVRRARKETTTRKGTPLTPQNTDGGVACMLGECEKGVVPSFSGAGGRKEGRRLLLDSSIV